MTEDAMLQQAIIDAERAAELSSATIREMQGSAEEVQVLDLLNRIWGRGQDNSVLPKDFLRVLGKTGNYISGAFVNGELVGASLGLHSSPERLTLHSHISGVQPQLIGNSIGYALKLHQRAWALGRGIERIEWTFDPLISRNANFNIQKLGAVPVEYLENFYGPMADAINAGDSSDRLLVRWQLRDPAVAALLAEGTRLAMVEGSGVVAVPDDIETLRIADPEKAREWRQQVRQELGARLASGERIIGFARGAGYILDQTSEKGEK